MRTFQERYKDHVRECTRCGTPNLSIKAFYKQEKLPFEKWYSDFYPLIPENREELYSLLERVWEIALENK